jgi:hypothetical protein
MLARTQALVRDPPRVVPTVRHLTPRQIAARLWLAARFRRSPADLEVELTLSAEGAGITLAGRIGARPVRVRDERCTSSS